MKRLLNLLMVIPFVALLAFVPKEENPLDTVIRALANCVKFNPVEKVHLHTDKPYYAVGDTIWFKAYVTIGSYHQLSAWSGALYVDLISEKDSILRTLKLPVSAGTTQGNFAIRDEWTQGNYRIRAYTQWMRNAGEDYFYDQIFSVGNSLGDSSGTSTTTSNNSKTTVVKSSINPKNSGYDVQFFPESGNLINGVTSKVAFKAIGSNGLGVEIKGSLIDEQNDNITDFKSEHLGMGDFTFKPESGHSYIARFTTPDGKLMTVNLPKALDDAYGLAVFQPVGDSLLVRINISETKLKLLKQNPEPINLVVQSSGEVIYSLSVNVTGLRTTIWLKKDNFPMGISQFTLFNARAEPLNERIAFIKNGDQMHLTVSSVKTSYKSKERIELQLLAKDAGSNPVAGSFSVAVTDETKVPIDESDENTIFSDILLKSDLKGYIEKPNYYFTKDAEDVNQALDNLMLTQGYRRFSWKEIITPDTKAPKFEAEKIGSSISGTVKSLNGKVHPGAKVKLFSLKSGIILETNSDMNGKFSFNNLVLTDSIRLTLEATTIKNGKKLEVIVDPEPKIGLTERKFKNNDSLIFQYAIKTYIENVKKQDNLLERMGGLSRAQRLQEVSITARKKSNQQFSVQGMFSVTEGQADQTFTFKNPESCATLGLCLQGLLQGVTFQPYNIVQNYPFSRNDKMDVFLNGRKLSDQEVGDVFDNDIISPSDIGKIDIVRTNLAVINRLGGAPALLIVTKLGYTRKTYQPNVVNISPKGFNRVQEFYKPKYDRPNNNNIPDLRSTIYWNADIKTYTTGKTSIDYFNGDGPGNYKVVIEGINANGELGRQVFRYKVEAGDQPVQTEFAKIDRNPATRGLDSLSLKLPVERAYLHLDKTSYSIGDTLWFKGYVTEGSALAATRLSGVLIVELNNDSAEVVRRISVPITKGIAAAQIPLPSKIFKEGAYTIRAYTNWMQNFGDGYFFSQRFYMGMPRADRWLARSTAKLDSTAKGNDLNVNISLFKLDNSPVSLRDVEVYVFQEDHYLFKEKIQTGSDGKIVFTKSLPNRAKGNLLRLELRSLHPSDRNQLIHVPLMIDRPQKIDLQFLPEGGKLVSGLKSKIGFKAIAENGRGITVEGNILNRNNQIVAAFSTAHNGMGSFEFTPLAGENYIAKITKPIGASKTYQIPKAANGGTVMTLGNLQESKFITVKIAATANVLTPDSTYYLIGTTRGKVYFSEKLKPTEQILDIAKTTFPTGITRFTLLKGTQPINERIVFINHQEELIVDLIPDKSSYGKRTPVSVEIQIKDKRGIPVAGNFSLSVTDDSQAKADSLGNQSIGVSFLLKSDLKGHIESPAYYFGTENRVAEDLDNLMLTQGWTDYDWRNVFSTPKTIAYSVQNNNRITGLVRSLNNKAVVGAPVIISSRKPSFLNTTITDSNGRYIFDNLPKIDTGSFFIQAKSVNNKAMTTGSITVDRFQAPRLPLGAVTIEIPWYVNPDSVQLRNYTNRLQKSNIEDNFIGDGRQLAEVNIVAAKIIPGSSNPYGPGKSDIALDSNDIKQSGTENLYQLLKQRVPGFKVIYDYEYMKGRSTIRVGKYVLEDRDITIDTRPFQIQIDGDTTVEKLTDAIAEYQLGNIKGVEVIYSKKFTNQSATVWNTEHTGTYVEPGYRAKPYEYAKIAITTTDGRGWYKPLNPDIVYYRPLPLQAKKEFYSPKYIISTSKTGNIDSRSTIFWEPNIITDKEGKAKISFYSSDKIGNYSITLEGSDMKGLFGSGKLKINIQL